MDRFIFNLVKDKRMETEGLRLKVILVLSSVLS